jgi:hypothetical protein
MIHYDSYLEFKKYAFDGANIIELGDQLMDIGHEGRYMRSDEYFKGKYNMVSIDWHGKNRALKLDLSKPLKEEFEADLLTDFGTTEHVTDLYNALLNCHNFTKEGGVMIHVNPKINTYPGHGNHWFTQKFWNEFGAACKYEVLSVYEKSPYSKDNPDVEVYAVFRKANKSKYLTRDQFEALSEFKVSIC